MNIIALKMAKLVDLMVAWDMYGQPISVNYRGDAVFKTKVGAFCSFATYALIIFNLVALVESFFDGS